MTTSYILARRDLMWAHKQLVSNNLIAWTSGNASVRLPDGNIMIKPSGVPYDELMPEMFTVVDPFGVTVEGKLKPSTDTLSHCFIYRNCPDLNAIVHTHSPKAIAWTFRRKPLPCSTTEQADVFGDSIMFGQLSEIGTEAIGEEALDLIQSRGNTCLLEKHGVLACGPSIKSAVQRAILVEHIATIHENIPWMPSYGHLSLPKHFVESCYNRYNNGGYGQ